MATETLTLTSTGSPAWSANSGTVTDAVAADDTDTTYISPDSVNASVSFTVSNSSVIGSTDSIPEVNVALVLRNTTSTHGTVTVYISDGTTEVSLGKLEVTSTTYATYTWSSTLIPDGTGAWTIAQVNSLQIRFTSSIVELRCTKGTVPATYYQTQAYRSGYPWDWADAPSAKQCAMTGMDAVEGDMEKGYIKEYAPHDRTRGIHPKRPRTGKSLGD